MNSKNKTKPTKRLGHNFTNSENFDEKRQKKLTLMAKNGDYVSYYYLGKIFAERKSIKAAMECYINSLKGSSIAAYEMGNLIKRYPEIYKSITCKQKELC